MSRAFKITLSVLLLAVAGGAIYLRGLHRQILRLAHLERSEDLARREVTHPMAVTPQDKKEKYKIFWVSREDPRSLEAILVELPVANEPAERARLVIDTLVANPPDPERRTLPPATALLEFYLLPDGTAIADFNDALESQTPSGIGSEELAVQSIVRTIAANIPAARRLKILIQGQEVETLAGHVDLGGLFDLGTAPTPEAPAQPPGSAPTQKAGGSPGLTPGSSPGTLKP